MSLSVHLLVQSLGLETCTIMDTTIKNAPTSLKMLHIERWHQCLHADEETVPEDIMWPFYMPVGSHACNGYFIPCEHELISNLETTIAKEHVVAPNWGHNWWWKTTN